MLQEIALTLIYGRQTRHIDRRTKRNMRTQGAVGSYTKKERVTGKTEEVTACLFWFPHMMLLGEHRVYTQLHPHTFGYYIKQKQFRPYLKEDSLFTNS